MSESTASSTDIAPPAATPPLSAPEAPDGRLMRRWGGAAGITGPVLLVVHFGTPALVGWPYAGAAPDQLIAFATRHALLFYAGGWLQVTGALLSVLFFRILLQLSGARASGAGAATLVGAALLLAVVTVEAALLEAVPMAGTAGDRATVATTFALSNGVFSRIFPLAPAPLLFAGIGVALQGFSVLPRVFARTARPSPAIPAPRRPAATRVSALNAIATPHSGRTAPSRWLHRRPTPPTGLTGLRRSAADPPDRYSRRGGSP